MSRYPFHARIANAFGALVAGDLAALNFSSVTRTTRHFAAAMNRCESPAEQAFLAALINPSMRGPDWLLADDGAALVHRTGRITIKPQIAVQTIMGDFRLDFCAYGESDYRLAIEVDGAEWHSSRAAVARDEQRDAVLVALGYSILRIPGAIVWQGDAACCAAVFDALRPYWRRVA